MMTALGRFFPEQGLHTLVRWNASFASLPPMMTETRFEEGLAVIDRRLETTAGAVKSYVTS